MLNVGLNGGGGGVKAEDVISKLKDDGDFDRLRLKIIRKLKENVSSLSHTHTHELHVYSPVTFFLSIDEFCFLFLLTHLQHLVECSCCGSGNC